MAKENAFIHYKAYCEVHHVSQTSPLGGRDDFDTVSPTQPTFFQELNQIAMRRRAVLTEIERLRPRESSQVEAVAARGVDILLSCLGLLICVLPFLVIGLAIKLSSLGPVFYRQRRVGKNGKVFQLIKFRTMFHHAEHMTGPVWTSANDPRLTSVGAFLRRTKLDELPQLFNILFNDMAFVGPRPERPEFVYWYTRYMSAFDQRHHVKPGLTGLAQLYNGYDQSAAHVYRKLRWDVQYIKRKCLRIDLWLMWYTAKAMLRGSV